MVDVADAEGPRSLAPAPRLPGRALPAAVVGLVGLAALLVVLFSRGASRPARSSATGEGTGTAAAMGIDGSPVRRLSPGVVAPIDLTLTNPHHEAMTVSGIAIILESVTAPQADPRHPCTLADFAVGQPSPGLRATLPGTSTVTFSSLLVDQDAWPSVTMVNRPVNQDGCKQARVQLAYSGSETSANR